MNPFSGGWVSVLFRFLVAGPGVYNLGLHLMLPELKMPGRKERKQQRKAKKLLRKISRTMRRLFGRMDRVR